MAICRSCGSEHEVGTTICPHTSESVHSGPCGTTIDRYQIETRLGGGGFGSVYRAKHTVLGQDVAIKILLPQHARNKEVAARFVREAKSAAAIKSTHIVSVTDFGTTAGNEAFLVMELLDGRDLETILHEEGKFAVEWALRFTEQILEGLAAAHAKGVVHRDMKPANVFVTRASDGAPWVKLVDFGISKAAEAAGDGQNLTRTGAVIGTPSYMSPEQFSGMRDVDHRTDLYAVAVILYQMLSGRLPYEEETYERLILRVMTEGPKPLREVTPGLPPSIYALVEKGLSREPADRFQSAAEFKEAAHRLLTQISGGARISVPPPSAVSGPSQAYASSHMHTPPMHTPAPGHFTPQQQDQTYPGQHANPTQAGSPHFTPAPYGQAPHYPTPADQHRTPQPLHNTPLPYGQPPSTPMAFDRPMSTTQKSGPSGVLIGFLIACGLGVLALVALIIVGVLSEDSEEWADTSDTVVDTNNEIQIEQPGVSNADPVLLNRVQSVLGLSEGDFNGCRVPGYLAHTQVNVLIVKAQITVPPPMTGTPDEQVAQCLASVFAQRANGTGPWFYPDGTAVSFNVIVPPQ